MDFSFFSKSSAGNGRVALFLRATCALASFSLATRTWAVSEPSLINGQKKSFAYSWQQEQKLGAESDQEVTSEMGVYDNPELQAYVESVGRRVLQQSQFNSPNAPAIYRDTKFTFRVIDSPVVNAFALPGGYVYVTRGLLSHVQNEAQLAVVLGHEIGHVAARHSSQQARRSQWTQLGVLAGSILGQKVLGERAQELAPALINGAGQAAQLFLLRYSREAETEADTLGVNYAAHSGYAADQSARFFESLKRLSATEGKALPTWQSTHPDPGDRAQHVVQLTATVPPQARSNVGEEEYLKHIEGIVVGEDPREGFAANGTFYHPELRFQMPVAAGWKLDNQKSAVMMSEPNGKAMMGLKLASGTRARDAAMQFAQSSKVQVTTSGDTMINGLPTTVIIGQGNTDEGAVGVWDAFIEMDGKVYSLLGYAPQGSFDQMRPTFESVAAGFSPLRDQSVGAVQPARLKLVRADRNAPFASYVPTALPPQLTADHVAIMNQVALNDQVNEGRILKVPNTPPLPQPAPVAAQPAPGYGQPAGYPNTYPQTGYPQSSYPPPQNYPSNGQDPQGYPRRYPQTQSYPQSQNYPAGNYPPPQNNPQSSYPPPSGYPQNQNYPNYPQSGYPQSSYPPYPNQGAYPQQPQRPQFPQPPATGDNRATNQPGQPAWPR